MNPISLTITNFGPFAEKQVIDFTKYQNTAVAITASNKNDLGASSNGSGKSYLPDALTWSTYDEIPRKIKSDEVIRRGTDQCEVVYKFEHNKKLYEVTNRRGKDTRFFFTVDGVVVEFKKKSDTVKSLSEHLGMDYDLFLNIVYLSQNSEKALLSSDPKDRIVLITKLLSLSKWDLPLKRTREKLRETIDNIESIDSMKKGIELADSSKSQEILKQEKDSLIEQEAAYRVMKVEVENKIKVVDSFKAILQNEKNQSENIQNLIYQRTQALQAFDKRMTDFSDTIKETKRDQISLEKEIEDFKVRAEQQFDQLSSELEKKEELQRSKTNLNDDINVLTEEISGYKSKRENLVSDRSVIEGQLVGHRNEESKLRKLLSVKGICPTCGTEIQESHQNSIKKSLEEAEKKIEEDNKRVYDFRDKIEQGIPFEKEATDSLNRKRADLEVIVSQLGKIESINLDVFAEEAKSQKESIEKKIQEKKDKINTTMSSLDEYKDTAALELKTLSTKITEVEQTLATFKVSEDYKNAVLQLSNITDIQSLETEKKQIDSNIDQVHRSIGSIENALKQKEENKKKIEEYENKKKALYRQQEILTFWERGFGDYGIKKLVINQFLPEFEDRSNKFLTTFGVPHRVRFNMEPPKTSGKEGEFKDSFEIEIRNDRGIGSWDSWSGGQKRRVAVAISQALRSLITQRLGIDIRFSIYDEVIDALDQQGIYFLMKVFKEVGGVHFVISHNHSAELQNSFEHNIHLEYSVKNNLENTEVVLNN